MNSSQGQAAVQNDRSEIRTLGQLLQRRLVAHVSGGTTDYAPAPMCNDAAVYSDAALLETERREIFLKLPLLAGLSRDIPTAGDRMIFDAAGPSILIVRNKAGIVKAYLNRCPHRAAKLVMDCRRGSRMSCPFHGWTFDLDGKLLAMPGPENFEGLDRAHFDLTPVPVAEWNGIIFVKVDEGEPAIDIGAHLGTLASELAYYDFAASAPIKSSRLDVRANWKFALDTYGEGYHVGAMHPDTVARWVIPDRMLYDGFGPHYRAVFASRQMLDYSTLPEVEWPEFRYSLIYQIFPNTIVQVSPCGGGQMHHVYRLFPGKVPGESFTLIDTYRSNDAPTDEPDQIWEEAHDRQRVIIGDEDYRIAATAQENLEQAQPDFQVIYGRSEIALQRFHRRIAQLIGRDLD